MNQNQNHTNAAGAVVQERLVRRLVEARELPECDCCGEPWCPVHMEHYGDCECLGPSNAEDEGWELEMHDGTLYGIRPLPAGGCFDLDEGACTPMNISRMNSKVPVT